MNVTRLHSTQLPTVRVNGGMEEREVKVTIHTATAVFFYGGYSLLVETRYINNWSAYNAFIYLRMYGDHFSFICCHVITCVICLLMLSVDDFYSPVFFFFQLLL